MPASFGRTMQLVRSRSVSAVSHRSDGFLRSAVAGLLRPAAGHEVHRVSGFRTEDPKVLGLVCRPHGAVHTPRRIPLVGSRSASLRSLPSCRCRSLRPSIRDRPPYSPLGPEGPGGRDGADPPRLGGCPRENRPKPFLLVGPLLPRNPGHVDLRSEQAPTSDLLAWGPFHVGYGLRRNHRYRSTSEATEAASSRVRAPLRDPSFLGIRWCSLRGRAGDAGALGVDITGNQVVRSFSVGVHHPRMALPAGAAVDESTSAASLPVRRSACADHLGPVMDPGLAAGGVHPGTTVPTCRSSSSRPPSGASSSGPSLPFDRRSGRSTRASRPWWSADVRLAAASGSRLRDCRSGHGSRDRATVAGRS